MTHRRRLLKAALAAPGAMVALHPRASAALAMSGNDACLFDLYADWLACEAAMAETFPALTRAEQAASARGVDWDDCPAVGAVLARQEAVWRVQQDALYVAAARPAASLDGIALKLAFWRRANGEMRHGQFTEYWDRLTFSAYDDMIAFTGRQGLALDGDAALRDVLRKTAKRDGGR